MQGWAADEALPQRANRRRRRIEDAASGLSPEPHGSSGVACAAADADGSADVGTAGAAHSSAASPAFAAADSGQLDDAPVQYEYLDHTADVQIHSWGATLTEAFEQQVVGMMGLITDLSTVNVDPSLEREVVVEGHDLESLLFHLLDEWLYQFNADLFVARRVRILELDTTAFRARSVGGGENFVLGRHEQGTEVKAVTYSAMRITQTDGRVDVLVIVDI